MRRRSFALTVAALVLVVVWGAACRQAEPPTASAAAAAHPDWPKELVFAIGLNPEDSEMSERSKPVIDRIQKATGLPIRQFFGTNYTAIVEAMRAKRIDGMQTGVFSYLLAEKEAGAEALAVIISSDGQAAAYDPRIRPEYNGIMIAKKGSGIRSVADLKGRTFNFGDPAGTSDHLIPKTELIRAGINPDKDIKSRFAGNHAAAILAVWYGTADAAATADSALRHFNRGGQVEFCDFPAHQIGQVHTEAEFQAVYDACPTGNLVTIHSAAIPGTPFAVRGDLPADLKATIRKALLDTATDPEFVQRAKLWYTDPSVEAKLPDIFAYYDSMRELATLLDLDLTRMK